MSEHREHTEQDGTYGMSDMTTSSETASNAACPTGSEIAKHTQSTADELNASRDTMSRMRRIVHIRHDAPPSKGSLPATDVKPKPQAW